MSASGLSVLLDQNNSLEPTVVGVRHIVSIRVPCFSSCLDKLFPSLHIRNCSTTRIIKPWMHVSKTCTFHANSHFPFVYGSIISPNNFAADTTASFCIGKVPCIPFSHTSDHGFCCLYESGLQMPYAAQNVYTDTRTHTTVSSKRPSARRTQRSPRAPKRNGSWSKPPPTASSATTSAIRPCPCTRQSKKAVLRMLLRLLATSRTRSSSAYRKTNSCPSARWPAPGSSTCTCLRTCPRPCLRIFWRTVWRCLLWRRPVLWLIFRRRILPRCVLWERECVRVSESVYMCECACAQQCVALCTFMYAWMHVFAYACIYVYL